MSRHSLDNESLSTASPVNGYTFRRGRHSGSFFLKIGAAGNQKNILYNAIIRLLNNNNEKKKSA
jgi:hypothetical protein